MPLTLLKAVQVDLTIKEVARAFAAMDDAQQSAFFNEVANYVDLFYKAPFEFQLSCAAANEKLTPEGRRIMELIGVYGDE